MYLSAASRVGAESASSDALPPLVFDRNRYEVLPDGRVTMNGTPTRLSLGTELKAWALMTIPDSMGSGLAAHAKAACAIVAVGKPLGSTETMLTCYEVSRAGPTGNVLASQSLETVLSSADYLAVFGKHLFLVHNATLRYYYYHTRDDELTAPGEFQLVSLGPEPEVGTAKWCRYIGPSVVLTATGGVFWSAEGQVYGIRVGNPGYLCHPELDSREKLTDLAVNGDELVLQLKDRNTGRTVTRSYTADDFGI